MKDEYVLAIKDISDERIKEIIQITEKRMKKAPDLESKIQSAYLQLKFKTRISKKSELKKDEFILRSKTINENGKNHTYLDGEYTFAVNLMKNEIVPLLIKPFSNQLILLDSEKKLTGKGLGAMIEARLIKRLLNVKINNQKIFRNYYYQNKGFIFPLRRQQIEKYGIKTLKVPIRFYLKIVQEYIQNGYKTKVYPQRKIEIENKRKAYQEKMKKAKTNNYNGKNRKKK